MIVDLFKLIWVGGLNKGWWCRWWWVRGRDEWLQQGHMKGVVHSPTLGELKLGSYSLITLVDAANDWEGAHIPRKKFPS